VETEREMGSKIGLTGLYMRVNGGIISRTGMGDLYTLTGMLMKANGRMIKQRDKGLMCTRMEPSMKVSGWLTSNLERGLRYGRMGLNMKVSMSMGRSMAKGSLHGLMAVSMTGTFMITTYRGKVLIAGRMEGNILEIGSPIKCMERDCSHGVTERNMKEITLKTKKKVWEDSNGLMERCIMDIGRMVNSTEKVS
jgi:hypothetical protein